ncbi:MAG: hypothetical protein E6J72_08780 [Deltaproteobacteria bacterium]|nr:MAG: hypothetical protein E6J72_08780 [Deltaproteobacteria bacterium]
MHSTVGIFERQAAAERTRDRLVALGFERDNVSLLTPANGAQAARVKTTDTEERGTGAAIGGVVGAATGASAGAAIAAFMPGVGPVVAAGWAAMALLGLAGAVGGGVAGNAIEDALSSGVPKDELFLYEDALRKGHTVVIALSDDTILIDAARKVMREEDAEDLDTARERWWIGVRPEDEEYREPAYRHGVEAALHPDARGKTWQEAEPFLAKRHGDIFRDEVFRRGYARGRAHHERWRETHRQ